MNASLLELRGVGKVFGGLRAVDGVSFAMPAQGIHSLIGPNGAGKTTLFNMISGVYALSTGTILFDGISTAGLSPARLAAIGISRTFQNLQIFARMTVLENVLVGAHLRLNASLVAGMLRLPGLRRADREAEAEARGLLGLVGLEAMAGRTASDLPFGALKRLEIARALMARPKLLLLDEPAAGLNPSEKRELQVLLRHLAGDGLPILLVEHDMKMIMSVSDHIVVLANGRKLAEGKADAVRADPAVIAAYLGRPPERVAARA